MHTDNKLDTRSSEMPNSTYDSHHLSLRRLRKVCMLSMNTYAQTHTKEIEHNN